MAFIPSNSNMTHSEQWGAQPRDVSRLQGPYANAKHSTLMQYDQGHIDAVRAPIDGDRFRPKTGVKDPVFLVIFVAQVFLISCVSSEHDDRHDATNSPSPMPLQFSGFGVVSASALLTWISQGGVGRWSGGQHRALSVTLDRYAVSVPSRMGIGMSTFSDRHAVYLLLFVVAAGLLLVHFISYLFPDIYEAHRAHLADPLYLAQCVRLIFGMLSPLRFMN